MTGQRPEGKRLMVRSAVCSSLLRTKTSLLASPPSASSPDITLLSGHLFPDVTWSTLTTLGSDRLPITVSLSSHAPPPSRKARTYTNFRMTDWEGLTAESERRFTETPLPTSCSAGEVSRSIPANQAAGPGHLAAHSPGSARSMEDPLGVHRSNHQSQALLVSSA